MATMTPVTPARVSVNPAPRVPSRAKITRRKEPNTVSPTMAEFLKSRAPAVSQRVEDELLPMWLRQRGLEGVAS